MHRQASTFISKFEQSVAEFPMKEAVRYTKQNMKWTAEQFKLHTDSHANALLEHEFKAGERVGIWLPESPEKHVAMMAAAKIGMTVVEIDLALNTASDVRAALLYADCKAIYFKPETEKQNNLLVLRKAVPELFYYDDAFGQHFHSKHFPNLKFFIHTGFDIEIGCLNFKSLFLPHTEVNKLDLISDNLTDDVALHTILSKDESSGELKRGEIITHGKATESRHWNFAQNIIGNRYFEST